MTSEAAAPHETAPWQLTREEADLVLAGLRMLRNHYNYRFREIDESGTETGAAIAQLIERLQAHLRNGQAK
jgi:hypothetical protein